MDYKTTIRTFTVSAGPQGRGWDRGAMGISSRGPPPPSLLPSQPCPHVQVAAELLEELCRQMGIGDPQEVQEFALFLIKGDGEPPGLGRKRGQAGLRELASPARSTLVAVGEAVPMPGRAVDLGSPRR